MNKIITITVLLVISFNVSAMAQGKEYQVKVACQYKKAGLLSSNYEFLKQGKNDLTIKAVFNTSAKIYEVPAAQHQELVNSCKALSERQGLVYKGISASVDSIFSNFYPLKDVGHNELVNAVSEAKKLYESYPNSEIIFDNIMNVPDKQSKDFYAKLATVVDERENLPPEFFLSDNVKADFHRDDLRILNEENKTLYNHSSRKVTVGNQPTKTYLPEQNINFSLEPFSILEKELNKNNEYKTPLLRKYIGLLFHTRMQGFEFPAIQDIMGHLALDPSILININKVSRAEHYIIINGDKLHANTKLLYLAEFINGTDKYPLGLIETERSVTLNLQTGKFGPEKIKLTKQK